MKKIAKIISQALTGAAAVATLFAGRAMAVEGAGNTTYTITENQNNIKYTLPTVIRFIAPDGLPNDLTAVVQTVSNTALTIIVAIAVIMIIYGGFRYIISGGDSKKITDAKNTVLYAIVGLIVAFLALAIVNFVIGAIGGKAS